MKSVILLLCFLLASLYAVAQTSVRWMPYMQQNGMYFSSDHITSAGAGIGLGLAAGLTFARLYCLPAKPNPLPANARLAPTW